MKQNRSYVKYPKTDKLMMDKFLSGHCGGQQVISDKCTNEEVKTQEEEH